MGLVHRAEHQPLRAWCSSADGRRPSARRRVRMDDRASDRHRRRDQRRRSAAACSRLPLRLLGGACCCSCRRSRSSSAASRSCSSQATGKSFDEVLFSGQDQLPGLVEPGIDVVARGARSGFSVFKGIGYALSLGSYRGGADLPGPVPRRGGGRRRPRTCPAFRSRPASRWGWARDRGACYDFRSRPSWSRRS